MKYFTKTADFYDTFYWNKPLKSMRSQGLQEKDRDKYRKTMISEIDAAILEESNNTAQKLKIWKEDRVLENAGKLETSDRFRSRLKSGLRDDIEHAGALSLVAAPTAAILAQIPKKLNKSLAKKPIGRLAALATAGTILATIPISSTVRALRGKKKVVAGTKPDLQNNYTYRSLEHLSGQLKNRDPEALEDWITPDID